MKQLETLSLEQIQQLLSEMVTSRQSTISTPSSPEQATDAMDVSSTGFDFTNVKQDDHGKEYCARLRQWFSKLPYDFAVLKVYGRWRKRGMSLDILPRWMYLVCCLVSRNPRFNYKYLVGPSSGLNKKMMKFLHYATETTTPEEFEYGLTNDLKNPCIKFCDKKTDNADTLMIDAVPIRLTKQQKLQASKGSAEHRKRPYLAFLSQADLQDFRAFFTWIVDNLRSATLLSHGEVPYEETVKVMRPNLYLTLQSNVPLFGHAVHIAVRVAEDGS